MNLKIARGKIWFFQYSKFTQKFKQMNLEINIRQMKPTRLNNSLLYLNFLSNSPFCPTMFMIFFLLWEALHIFLLKIKTFFGSLAIFAS